MTRKRENLGFKGTLVVAVHGPVENPSYGITKAGVQELGFMINHLQTLIPQDQRVLVAHGDRAVIRESAEYFRRLGQHSDIEMSELSNDSGYDRNLAGLVISGLLANEVHDFGVLVVVTTSMMSGWVSGFLHHSSPVNLQVREGAAWLTQPNGKRYLVDSSGIQPF